MAAPNQTDRRARAGRGPRPQAVLAVRGREQLSHRMVRIVAGGPGFAQFRTNEFTDKYAKLLFVDPALGLRPPYDLEVLRESLPPEQRPVTRTYTVRSADPDRQQLTIDFVTHGDHGIAAPWAAHAVAGDLLALSGAGGAYRPDPGFDWHLFAGDESALPAINSALEALPRDARGMAYLETDDASEHLDVTVPNGIDVVWLHREEPGTTPQLLADAVEHGEWPSGRVSVFAHGERASMKAVRTVVKSRLRDEDALSLSGYWAHGRAEEVFQAEKRQPVGQLD